MSEPLTIAHIRGMVEQMGGNAAAARALGVARSTLRRTLNAGCEMPWMIGRVYPLDSNGLGLPTTGNGSAIGGAELGAENIAIALKDRRVRRDKPAPSPKKLLFSLKRGVGYPVSKLADVWGVSEETVAKRARQYDCLRYVEVEHEFIRCVVHPDTAESTRSEQ